MIFFRYCCWCRDDIVRACSVIDEYDMDYCSEECRDRVNVPHFDPMAIANDSILYLSKVIQYRPNRASDRQRRAYKMYVEARNNKRKVMA
jgi:hypothetical protein